MTDELKDILTAKMLDNPSALTDADIEAILADDELRDIYEMSAAVSGASVEVPRFDMDAEWQSLQARMTPRRRRSPLWWGVRAAAVLAGVALATGLLVRMADTSLQPGEKVPVIAKVHKPVVEPVVTPPAVEDEVTHEPAPVAKELPRVKRYAPAPSPAPVETEPEIDIDEYVRIQQARIDNDLALQAAEVYRAEFDALYALDDCVECPEPEHDPLLASITMQ